MTLSTSYGYIQRVQSKLCRFLLRHFCKSSSSCSSAQSPPATPHTATNSTTNNTWSSSMGTGGGGGDGSAATSRFGKMLLQMSEVKCLAFRMENFLLARYRSAKIPQESLLAEMLLTKRKRCLHLNIHHINNNNSKHDRAADSEHIDGSLRQPPNGNLLLSSGNNGDAMSMMPQSYSIGDHPCVAVGDPRLSYRNPYLLNESNPAQCLPTTFETPSVFAHCTTLNDNNATRSSSK